MQLWVGLGNPGPKHAAQRHNIGFMALDRLHDRQRLSAWRTRFQALACEAELGGARLLLLKPQSYMNRSGHGVAEAVRFYKLSEAALVVFHDELDLAFGKLRVKTGGGVAGHNGLRSIDACLGTRDFRRVRLGIGHPGDKDRVVSHVLGDFARSERPFLDTWLDAIAEAAPALASGDEAGFMNKVALRAPAPKPAEPDSLT